jgi:hypothetical protein
MSVKAEDSETRPSTANQWNGSSRRAQFAPLEASNTSSLNQKHRLLDFPPELPLELPPNLKQYFEYTALTNPQLVEKRHAEFLDQENEAGKRLVQQGDKVKLYYHLLTCLIP